MPLVISGAILVDDDPPRVRRGHLLIEAGKIRDLFLEPPSMRADREWIDAAGCLVMPGFVNAHTHLYRTLSRGAPDPKYPPRHLKDALQHVWWPYDRALDRDVLAAAARVGVAESIRAGVTALIDHNASPYACDRSLDIVADVIQDAGLRGVVSYEVSDRDGLEERLAGVAENFRFLTQNKRSRVRGMLGAQASATLSDESLAELARLAREFGVGLHLHAAEGAWDQDESHERYRAGVIERLEQAGLLDAKAVLAHGVALSPAEIASIRAKHAWLVHNPRANQARQVGYALAAGQLDRVALGTDGESADLLEEAKSAYYRARDAGNRVGPDFAWTMIHNSQRLAGQLLGEPFGYLRAGAPADLLIFEYDPPTPLHAENFAAHLVHGISTAQLRDVIVGGRVVMRDRKLLTIDEAAARTAARPLAQRLWDGIQDPGHTDPNQTMPEQTGVWDTGEPS